MIASHQERLWIKSRTSAHLMAFPPSERKAMRRACARAAIRDLKQLRLMRRDFLKV